MQFLKMKVTSQNYDAEFGKAVAGLVTAQTKSGSNSFHGSAFEYRRSDAQQARDPFANAFPDSLTGKYLAPTLHNQFGGSVGGPIVKGTGYFSLTDYQGLREKTGTSTLTTVPTTLALSSCTSGGPCDLSDYLQRTGQIYSQIVLTDTSNAGRVPFPGNIIPAADVSPQAVAFFKLLPAPNVPETDITNNYSASGSGIFNTDQWDVRGDSYVRRNSTSSVATLTSAGICREIPTLEPPADWALAPAGLRDGFIPISEHRRGWRLCLFAEMDHGFPLWLLPDSKRDRGTRLRPAFVQYALGIPNCNGSPSVALRGFTADQHLHSEQWSQRRPEYRVRDICEPQYTESRPSTSS